MHILLQLFFFLFFLTPQISHALTPPLSEEELQRDADLIVVGEVSQAVECLGILEETECFKQWQYFASLKVQGLVKGRVEEGQKIKIIFYQNDYSKSDCVGDQGAVLQSGDRGTYYLKQEKNGSYSPLHWNAVKLIHSGGNSLPKCD